MDDWITAVNELVINVLRHGGGHGRLRLIAAGRLICEVADHGPGFDTGRYLARSERPPLSGTGGMGSVWAAHHLSLNVEVALKFIDASVAKRNDVASRFAQEAQAAAKVKGSHVVNIFDFNDLRSNFNKTTPA